MYPGEETRDEIGFLQSKPMNRPWETWAINSNRESMGKCSEFSVLTSSHVGSNLHNFDATLILPIIHFKIIQQLVIECPLCLLHCFMEGTKQCVWVSRKCICAKLGSKEEFSRSRQQTARE